MARVLCPLYLMLLSTITGGLVEQCREGATFPDAIISPNLKTTQILRVPHALSVLDCTAACCNLPGCDLAWLFENHCYIVNCQQKDSCEPKKRTSVDSYLTFVQRTSPETLALQSLVRGRLHSQHSSQGDPSASVEDISNLIDYNLFARDQSFEQPPLVGEYPEDFRPLGSEGSFLNPKLEQKESSGLMHWQLATSKDNFSLSSGETGESEEELLDLQNGIILQNNSQMRKQEGVEGRQVKAPESVSVSLEKSNTVSLPGIVNDSVPLHNISLTSTEITPTTKASRVLYTTQKKDLVTTLPASTEPAKPTTAKPTIATTSTLQPVKGLVVSAGDNVEVILPKNEVELNAFVVPAPPKETFYSYEWSLISHPANYEGEMESKHTKSLKLSRLSPGLYIFKVTVSGDNSYGESFVNVTVKPAARVNKPPTAIASPRTQDVSLPTSSTFIDGSQSTDDDKIVSYHWEEIKGPLREHKASADSPVLHLLDLVPGNYTFRLPLTFENSTTAMVTVNKPVDYPPVASAGPNQAITLPHNYITLNGNQSSDDHKIASYEWSLSPNSKDKVVAMQGVRTQYLQLSAMQEGDYTFQLTVTDSAGQQATAQVTVIVQPENNSPPVAVVGPDKELTFPVESTTLDGSKSTDDQGIVLYQWQNISGPSGVKFENGNTQLATVIGLQIGTYRFRLTVKDQQGLTSSAVATVTVKKERNIPPIAHAGGGTVLVLPNNSVVLNGSKSTDDQGIVSYLWIRDGQSPAAGDVLYSSDHEAVLQLINLVEGTYIFQLLVTDAKGDSSTDTATVEVRPDPRKKDVVEMELQVGASQLTEQQKDTLVRQLAVLLNVLDSDIKVQKIQAHSDLSTVMSFYVLSGQQVLKGMELARTLRGQLLKEKADFLMCKVLRVDTALCLLVCSDHGHCDPITKRCVCYPFWMENLIRRYFGDGESNCEWSVLYVVVATFFVLVLIIAISWIYICCCKRKRRTKVKKKNKYTILDNIDEQERMEPRPKYGIKHRSTEHNCSLMMSESEFESEQDTIFTREKTSKGNPKNGVNSPVKNGDAFSYRPKDRCNTMLQK
ncbi:dyslexia-associated protein KIAA0319 [Polyodon spathula]|uniref:dyslexia-associated protein KIAA0319 n=1 Tax=Polyodon spathula TaxID=7913 RepID=UPI001B7DDAF8|nr:dyslexia-associated protein KIAA0319 [Polyodon spathula]